MLKNTQFSGFGGKAAYAAKTVENNANNAYIYGTGATALTTGQQESWILSVWLKPSTVSGTQYLLHTKNAPAFKYIGAYLTTTAIAVLAGGGTNGLNFKQSSTGVIDTNSLQHILISVDLSRANADKIQVYVDDADVTMGSITATTGSNNMDGEWGFLTQTSGGANALYADQVSDFYFSLDALDFDTETNRRKFISPSGARVNLGADGSHPTGNQPLWYWGGTMLATDWDGGDHLGSDVKTFSATNNFTDV